MEQLIIYGALGLVIILYLSIFISVTQNNQQSSNIDNQTYRIQERSSLLNNDSSSDEEAISPDDEQNSKDFFTINIRDNYVIDKSH